MNDDILGQLRAKLLDEQHRIQKKLEEMRVPISTAQSIAKLHRLGGELGQLIYYPNGDPK